MAPAGRPSSSFSFDHNDFQSIFTSQNFLIILIGIIFFSICIILCACCGNKKDEAEKKNAAKTKQIKSPKPGTIGKSSKYEDVTTHLAVNLLQNLESSSISSTGGRPSSFVASSYGLHTALGLCYFGSDGQTRKDLERWLFCLQESKTSQESAVQQELQTMIETTKSARLNNAKSSLSTMLRLYGPSSTSISEKYKKRINNLYGNDQAPNPILTPVDYQSTNANQFSGMINEFLGSQFQPVTLFKPPLHSSNETRLILVNGVIFNDHLAIPFDRRRTRYDVPFFVKLGRSVKCPMMRQSNVFGFYENEEFQAVRMHYKNTKNAVVYFLLPRIRCSLDQFEKNLSADKVISAFKSCAKSSQYVQVTLPKFKMETELVLDTFLAKSDMQTIMSKSGTDFSRMIEEKQIHGHRYSLWLSGLVQKAIVEFDDEEALKSMKSNSSIKKSSSSSQRAASHKLIMPQSNISNPKLETIEEGSQKSAAPTSSKSDTHKSDMPHVKITKPNSEINENSPTVSPNSKSNSNRTVSLHSASASVDSSAKQDSSISEDAAGTPSNHLTFTADHPFLFFVVIEPPITPILVGRFCGPPL